MARTIAITIAAALIAGIAGYTLGASSAPQVAIEPSPEPDREPREEDDALALESDPSALQACEDRLASAEAALALRPARAEGPAIDPATLPEPARVALESPEVSRAIDAEVERRMTERIEQERARREAEWAARRAELRERLRAIGIDDATMGEITPTLCAIRDVYRQAWQDRRAGAGGGGGGDAGVRGGRRALREATRPMREEVEQALGPERTARLEDEGGMRALGMAAECGDGPR
ncbi:hypothetical protein [Sandaracinus amylolyticus]|uniref:Uncharacterized protein n=1 Tax=Sandaracinus amylolyticus TaxID=927083 RepID=A0A0F6YM75_9BACT|nr:hypothetical protein [Sandaracinus amylolyticus]AKF10388.1 hypothetical protein DB32_007537 [Sandaracinus amylolyticus]